MYDGSQYHLMVSGTQTGSSQSISFDESAVSNSGFSLGLSTATITAFDPQGDKTEDPSGIPFATDGDPMSPFLIRH